MRHYTKIRCPHCLLRTGDDKIFPPPSGLAATVSSTTGHTSLRSTGTLLLAY